MMSVFASMISQKLPNRVAFLAEATAFAHRPSERQNHELAHLAYFVIFHEVGQKAYFVKMPFHEVGQNDYFVKNHELGQMSEFMIWPFRGSVGISRKFPARKHFF